uniref:Protein-tyrosine-phosphatase n=1 Tax=Syphacia muris TaxID=451379 RepID=A0A0N5AJA9_9BILA
MRVTRCFCWLLAWLVAANVCRATITVPDDVQLVTESTYEQFSSTIGQSTDMEHLQVLTTLKPTTSEVSIDLPQNDSPMADFHVEKDAQEPSRLLTVYLSKEPTKFKQYFVKLVDVSSDIEPLDRDSNRTFLPSPPDAKIINVRGLHPGHRYGVSFVGRKNGESMLLKDEYVTMDPVAPDFYSRNASISSSFNNITLRALKPENALQEKFYVKYFQIEPYKNYQPLEVYDINEQKHIEIYIGNLNPGRDYNVTVTSLIDYIESKPWRGLLTTRPLSPIKLAVIDSNLTCVTFHWELPANSGVDRFLVQYNEINDTSKIKRIYVERLRRTTSICDLKPGLTFTFGVKSEKIQESSDMSFLDHTLRPKPPESFSTSVDYKKKKFLISVTVPSEAESYIDGCNISIASEGLQDITLYTAVKSGRTINSPRKCIFYASLHPGYRYEISVLTTSKDTKSVKLAKSFALEPGFGMKEFEITLREIEHGFELKWPTDDASFERLQELWKEVVGDDSTLHLNLELQTSPTSKLKEEAQKYVMHISQKEPLILPNLLSGACYKVQIYTVTKFGIVSIERFEEYIRLSVPAMNLTVENVTKSSAKFYFQYSDSVRLDRTECYINVLVLDMHSSAIYNRSLSLATDIVPVLLNDLRPYHKYTINTQIICGRAVDKKCSLRVRTLRQVTFETKQDRPGPVQNLTVRPLNPYSVQLSWMPPALPNGIITHYIARIHPFKNSESEWSVNVSATPQQFDHTVNAVVDNLIGGLSYRMDVRAVTEAGEGQINAISDAAVVVMPVLPPPQPTSRIEILYNTVRSYDVTVRYSTAMFSTKHGLLLKSALIVTEVTNDGKSNEFWSWEHRNSTPSWRDVQHFDIWPPYVAIETPIEPIRKFFPPRSISEVIGVNSSCEDTDADRICNGPLKPGSNYKFKLRLYTAMNLWTDTEYSDVVTTVSVFNGF